MPVLFYRNNQLFGGRHRRSIVIDGGEHTHSVMPMEISRLLQLSRDIEHVDATMFAVKQFVPSCVDGKHSRHKREVVDHIGTVIQVVFFS